MLTAQEITEMADAFEASEFAKHWSDRRTHYVIANDGAILLEFPGYRDDDEKWIKAHRIVEQRGSALTCLGREFHLPSHDIKVALEARNILCFGD